MNSDSRIGDSSAPSTTSVVVAGSYNAGLTAYSERLPTPGETVLGHRFDLGPGGKGANQAIGIARLGVDVVFATKLGNDVFGAQARSILLDEGLPSHGILTGTEQTGMALILVDRAGRNAISVVPGVNLKLTSAEVIGSLDTELRRCGLILCQLECPTELAVGLARWGRDHGKTTVLNPAPARVLAAEDLQLFDVLTPNESELAAIARGLGQQSESIEVQAKTLLDCGASTIVATLGEQGAMRVSSDGMEHFPAYPVEAVDTTGAGDAFTAALVAALAHGVQLDDAIDNACRAGAFCVTWRGVIDGLATSDQLKSFAPPARNSA